MTFNTYINTLRLLGYLAYEYNPFHNYQTNVDLYLVNDKFLVPFGKAVYTPNGKILNLKDNKWIDENGIIYNENIVVVDLEKTNCTLYATAGSIIDLDTDLLNFDLEHPVDIEVLPSYDGSVNLILNDGKNIPRIINSRFSQRGNNTYEIVDRIGENDTNVYSSESFDKDTSLYFQYKKNPIIKFSKLVKGILPVGQYVVYITYCDADNNESDYIAESGLIPIFLGMDGNPLSMDGGIKNLKSDKGFLLYLSNIDTSYNYIKVYYVRYLADYNLSRVVEGKSLYNKIGIYSNEMVITITGEENVEEFDVNLLNISRFNPKSINTQALCKNMLFFGNIVKNYDNYKELNDISLRIIPQLYQETILNVSDNYETTNGEGYYNINNMYNKVGYFPQEFYHFGIVYIYNDGTLSNVYNTLGAVLTTTNIEYKTNTLYEEIIDNALLKRIYIESDNDHYIKNTSNYYSNVTKYLNDRGVCYLDVKEQANRIYGIKFSISNELIEYLRTNLGIRGCFFVRQKRMSNVISQCFILPFDRVLRAPILYYNNLYRAESFLYRTEEKTDSEVALGGNYDLRLLNYNTYNATTNPVATTMNVGEYVYAGVCPDFLLDLPHYNSIFNGNDFYLKKINAENTLSKNDRIYTESRTYNDTENNNISAKICSVTDNVTSVAINDLIFKSEIGVGEEASLYGFAMKELTEDDRGGLSKDNHYYNIVRGKYSPYLAIYSEYPLEANQIYNIYYKNNFDLNSEFQKRINFIDAFYAINDRTNFEDLSYLNTDRLAICYRGDCFLNTFTYRLNRNFNDPSLPNNDTIIKPNTWNEDWGSKNLSRSDINAVMLGSWITFKVRSSYNYALRSVDHSYVAEEALMGSPRTFYPKNKMMYFGNFKMPDSYLYNDAFRATLGYKCYFALQDLNYLKNSFTNRIQYSSIAIQDSYKNNYRESLSTYFRDYSIEYGAITKIMEHFGNLLVIFEHAIGIAAVNERILSGNGDGGEVFINTQNVLPEELNIISSTYGSLWKDSIIKSESEYVYGVDTISKKIWKLNGQQLQVISDLKVNKFLIDNINLKEHLTSPIIGIRNVKTHYNNNKKDVMFTFYNNVYLDEEKSWNLCYNEILDNFITFYSWIPSFSENIGTLFFTFNRDTSKKLTLLDKCTYVNSNNTGVLLENPILDINLKTTVYYRGESFGAQGYKTIVNDDGTTYLEQENNYSTDLEVNFKLEKDHWLNYKLFRLSKSSNTWTLQVSNAPGFYKALETQKVLLLYITPYKDSVNYFTEPLAVTVEDVILNKLTTDFYLHGQSGIFNVIENLYPTYWYGEYHPFEFEFVVADKVGVLKIFNNLVLISNKAEPESFHFTVEGDNYDFSNDKRTMYFRLEATKEQYQNLGSDILFDRYYTDVAATKYTQELGYNLGDDYLTEKEGLVLLKKSSIFPLYYERVDTYNELYDKYYQMMGNGYDFKNLSGSEIKWDRKLNQFLVVTHIKNNPIEKVGILRGNSRYKEGSWNIQIPTISFMQKNEEEWTKPPLVINSQYVPTDLASYDITIETLPNIYKGYSNGDLVRYIDTSDWTYRKETRIRDKWIKIRVRYSGKNLAVIHGILTLYNTSYA